MTTYDKKNILLCHFLSFCVIIFLDRVAMVSRARLGVRCRHREDVRLDSRNPKIDRVVVVSHARLGVRRRYRDGVRLDSRYANTGWQWCHVLVSASVVAPATTSASTRVTLRQGGSGVTCSSRRPSSLPR